MIWVVQEVDQYGSDSEAEHVAKSLASTQMEAKRVLQESAETAIGPGEPLGDARSEGHR